MRYILQKMKRRVLFLKMSVRTNTSRVHIMWCRPDLFPYMLNLAKMFALLARPALREYLPIPDVII